MDWGVRAALVAMALILGGCGIKPGDIAVDAGSSDAVLLIKFLPTPATDYSIIVGRYDPQEMQITKSSFDYGSWERFSAGKTAVPKFVAKPIRPGTYAFFMFEKQDHWNLCFHRETLYFTVRPGQILYLGTFNPNTHIAELTNNVVTKSNTVARQSDYYHYMDNISGPHIVAPGEDEAALADARKFVAAEMPQVRVDVQPVAYTRTKFGTGQTLVGEKMCGGYFREDVREQAKAPAIKRPSPTPVQ